jgi:hypothetical protein
MTIARQGRNTSMEQRYAFLIGAGASKGAGGITPYDPPLRAELYGYLVRDFPTTWGALPDRLDALFRDNFDIGMAELWDNQLNIGTQLIIEMGIYFSRFDPPPDGLDLLFTVDLAPQAERPHPYHEDCDPELRMRP